MIDKIFLATMIVFAILSIQTCKLRRAVIYLAIFSLINSFAFIFYGAPDVAMAEAIIGTTLSTVLFLIALKKYRIFTIYYIHDLDKEINDKYIKYRRNEILKDIEKFYIKQELEPQSIYTTESVEHIMKHHDYDLIIYQKDNGLFIYGDKENYKLDDLNEFLKKEKYSHLNWSIIRYDEEKTYETT